MKHIQLAAKEKNMQFQGFAQVWTPVAYSTDLVRSQPLGVEVAGEKVVLFRDAAGKLIALADRCPHRGASLSLGSVNQGCLVCPFHGWRFGREGECVQVPWNPDARRELLKAIPVPARELGGLLWIYTREGEHAPTEPELPSELLRSDVRLSGQTFPWKAHWTRAVENLLDDSHLPFVHPKTIGRSIQPRPDSRLDSQVESHSWGCSWTTSIDGKIQGQSAEFRWPNMMLLRIPVPGKLLAIYFAAIPVNLTSVRILQLSIRNFLRWQMLDPVFHRINKRVLLEDKAVVESSPTEVPPPHEERSVRTDALCLAFRKRYFGELAMTQHSMPDPRAQPASGSET